MVLASPKADGTHIFWFYGRISDGNSSEVITIDCGGVEAATDTPVPPTDTPLPPPPPVGGVAFDPEVGGLPLEAAEASDRSAGLLAGVVAAAAGVLVFGGAVYARRRVD